MNAAIHELEALCRDLRQFPCLSRAEHAALLARAQAGDRAAREQFLAANIPLVISIARRYVGHGLALDDLVQEGTIGLIRALDKFELSRGYQFSTYATCWIRQAVSRACLDAESGVHVPVHVHDKLRVARRLQNAAELVGESLGDQEVAQRVHLSADTYQAAAQVSSIISLDMPLDNEMRLADVLIAPGDVLQDVEEDEDAESLRANIAHALELLPPREQRVVRLRYGLDGGAQHTLSGVSEQLGISRERARQLEVQALRMLRSPEARRRLAGEPAQRIQEGVSA